MWLLKDDLEHVAQILFHVHDCREQQVSSESSAITCSLRRVHTTPNTMTNLSVSSVAVPTECLVCSELALLIHFFPCQHSIVCEGKSIIRFSSWTLINQALFRHEATVLFVSWNNPSVISVPPSYLRCPKLSMKSRVFWLPQAALLVLTDALDNSDGKTDVSVLAGSALSIKSLLRRISFFSGFCYWFAFQLF